LEEVAPRDGLRQVEYSVFNPETGEVLRGGTTQLRDMASQAGPGEVVIEGAVDGGKFMIEVGAAGIAVVKRASPPPSIDDVQRETRRRIESRYPIWQQLNVMAAGGEPMIEMRAFIDAVRKSSNRIERMTPIPQDFTDDRYWTGDANG